jgi:hypothetical protein
MLLLSLNCYSKSFLFNYPKANLKVGIIAENYTDAFKKAAKECFKILTKDKYQGEEKSLDIIDICVNPE